MKKKILFILIVAGALLFAGSVLGLGGYFYKINPGANEVPHDTFTRGLVGYWDFDEGAGQTATDLSGNQNHGTLGSSSGADANDPSWTKGQSSEGGLSFDGSNDYVDCGNNASLGPTNELSIELWVKLNDISSAQYLITRGYGNGYSIYYKDGAGGFKFEIDDDTAGSRYIQSENLGYTTSDWYHVVGTWNGTNLKIYVNGISYGTETGTNSLGSSGTFRICSYFNSPTTYVFNGQIDQVRIYNRALSAEEVRYHYNRGGPVAEWNFDEGSGSTAYDSTGNGNDGVLTNMDDSDWVEGKFGTALDFDGTDDVATVAQNSSINLTSKKGYTVSSWIYPHSDGEADVGEIIDKGTNTYLRVDSESAGLLDVEAKLDLATADATLNITDAVPINAWSHIVLTYEDDDDDEITIYVNGINKGTSSDGDGAPATDSNNLLIGGDAAANFDGLIDSVKIYSYARTAPEILLDYNKGKAAHFGLSTTDCDADPASCMDYGLVGNWGMDEGAGQTATDLSGNQNHGTLGSTSGADANDPSWTKGQSSGGGLSFDGTDDYVDCGSVGEIKTISFWVKPGTTTEDIMETWGVSGDNVTFTYRGGSATYGTVSHNSECWLDRNLGASQAATAYNDANAYGDLFQWGRLDDNHQDRVSGTTSTNSATDNPGHSNFILEPNDPWDWRDPQNDNLWQGVSGTNNPCPTGWRIPTETELNTECLSWSSNDYDGAYASPLKLTVAGYRSHGSGSLSSAGSNGFYWSSAISGTNARYLHFTSGDAFMASLYRAYGFSVRCLKDDSESGISILGGTISAHDFVSPTIYVDGVVSSTIDTNWHLVIITSDTGLNASKLNIGKIGTGYFNGQIDQVRIYNRALSAEEIRYHYNRGGPVAEWNFDEGSGSIAYDSTGNGNDGILTNMDDSDWVEGKYGTALDFDGTDDVATVAQNSSINLTSKKGYTVSSWIYPHSDGEADVGEIIDKGTNTYLRVDSEVGGLLDIEAKLDLATADATLNITDAVSINAWSHVVLAYEDDADDEITIYVNGINKGTSSDGNGSPSTDSNNLLIGGDAAANFDGLIDSVKIYSYARTAPEILLDYNKGKAAHFGLSTTDCDKDPASCMDYGLVGNWGMDEGAGQTATDLSGNQNHGTLGADSSVDVDDPTWTKGQSSGGGLSFDGTDDYVDVNSICDDIQTGSLSIEMWINSDVATQYLFRTSSAKNDIRLYMKSIDNKLYWEVYSGTAWVSVDSQSAIPVGSWQHIVATFSTSDGMALYVNGISKDTDPNTSRGDTFATVASISKYLTNYFNGQIDEVCVYNRALSAEEVRYHYNRGGPVAEWKMNERTGAKIYDSTSNNNDGKLNFGAAGTNTSYEDMWQGASDNLGIEFDGTDDYVDVPSLSAPTNKTFSLWVYPHSYTGSYNTLLEFGNDSPWFGLSNTGQVWMYNTIKTDDTLTQNIWSHIVYTSDGSIGKIYINGSFSKSGTENTLTGSGLGIGYLNGDTHFDGEIDFVRVYNRALSASEILERYWEGKMRYP